MCILGKHIREVINNLLCLAASLLTSSLPFSSDSSCVLCVCVCVSKCVCALNTCCCLCSMYQLSQEHIINTR